MDDTVRDTLRGHVGSVLSTFRDGEANVISRRFGLEDGREHTLQEIATGLGVSRERVRQIERKALRRLRFPSRLRPLRELLETGGVTGKSRDSEHSQASQPAHEDGLVH